MTKKDIIKQEIIGKLLISDGIILKNEFTGMQYNESREVVVVDVDKLATLLAKYLDIKIEDENEK